VMAVICFIRKIPFLGHSVLESSYRAVPDAETGMLTVIRAAFSGASSGCSVFIQRTKGWAAVSCLQGERYLRGKQNMSGHPHSLQSNNITPYL
jgi:hypothetical protein